MDFDSPDPPRPEPVSIAPEDTADDLEAARRAEVREGATRRGRRSTILTGGTLGDPTAIETRRARLLSGTS